MPLATSTFSGSEPTLHRLSLAHCAYDLISPNASNAVSGVHPSGRPMTSSGRQPLLMRVRIAARERTLQRGSFSHSVIVLVSDPTVKVATGRFGPPIGIVSASSGLIPYSIIRVETVLMFSTVHLGSLIHSVSRLRSPHAVRYVNRPSRS